MPAPRTATVGFFVMAVTRLQRPRHQPGPGAPRGSQRMRAFELPRLAHRVQRRTICPGVAEARAQPQVLLMAPFIATREDARLRRRDEVCIGTGLLAGAALGALAGTLAWPSAILLTAVGT